MHAAAIDRIPARRALRAARLRGLYALTPDLANTRALVDRARAAIAGGATAVQYRNKAADPALRLAQARALAAACRDRALFIVNDDAALAAAVEADGVHLGEHDVAIAEARKVLGEDALIGVSCYDDLARARAAVAEGADCIAFGSVFASPTKPDARRAPLSLFGAARALGVPLVAIGGIHAANAGEVIEAGADAVAVIADVMGREDLDAVRRAARAVALACEGAPAAGGGR